MSIFIEYAEKRDIPLTDEQKEQIESMEIMLNLLGNKISIKDFSLRIESKYSKYTFYTLISSQFNRKLQLYKNTNAGTTFDIAYFVNAIEFVYNQIDKETKGDAYHKFIREVCQST